MDNSGATLGIIAGNGLLPAEIASLYIKRGGRICIASVAEETDVRIIGNYPYNCKQFSIGSVAAIFDYFKKNDVREIIIIGGIARPDLKSIKVDIMGTTLIAKILKEKFLGDDNILKSVADFIESKGFKVISPKTLLGISDYEKLYNTRNLPTKQDRTDINLGKEVLRSLGSVDVGQSVVVANGYVLGIEAAEGTDNLIGRCALLRKNNKGGVLVKMAKIGQDLRLDLPTIGPDTAFHLAQHGYNGIAIEVGGVIIIKPEETIALLNDSSLFLHYIV